MIRFPTRRLVALDRLVAFNFAFLASSLLIATSSLAVTVRDISTGYDNGTGTTLPSYSADPDYSLMGPSYEDGPADTPLTFQVMESADMPAPDTGGFYLDDASMPGSRWLCATSGPDCAFYMWKGEYRYRTAVDLTGYDYTQAYVQDLIVSADNGFDSLVINGQTVIDLNPSGGGQLSEGYLPLGDLGHGHFSSGVNTVDFFVTNGEFKNPTQPWSPTAFRASATVEAPVMPSFSSNASFDAVSDIDVINLDFGTLEVDSAAGSIGFSLSNLLDAGTTAHTKLLSITGSGDTDMLTTDLAPFLGLAAGSSLAYDAFIDTRVPDSFNASYDLNFTDVLGTNQTLTLNLSGLIEATDDPAVPDLIYHASTGEVEIEPAAGSDIIGYTLKSDGDFTEGNFTPVLGGLSTALPGELSEANFSGISSVASLGVVLPAGLSEADVYNTLTERTASAVLGGPLEPFEIEYLGGCAIGDADCDGDVDISGDILPAFSNFTGPGSFGMTRADGDVHGDGGATTFAAVHDGDVDVSDLLLMFSEFTGPLSDAGLAAAQAADPSVPDLIYDSATGEVVLDVDGSGIIGYVLKNGAGTFLAGNHTTILAGVSTSIAGELSEAAFASSVGANSIGFVFPTGMDLAALSAYLSTNEVSSSLGAPVVPFDLVVLNAGPAVPEPSACVLAALAILGLATFARRRNQR